jgi:CPA1 family monovalent cation:H+ antiporter
MDLFAIFSVFFTLAVLITYVNHRFVKMDSTIALTLSAVALSVGLIVAAHFGFGEAERGLVESLNKIDFHALLMNGMLGFLLFAGALNVEFDQLKEEKIEIIGLALVGTVVSTLIIGTLSFYFFQYMQVDVKFIYCLLFGALISPTDPIAVLAIFKKLGAPSRLDARLAGESLFNDGVGVVLFLTIYSVAYGQDHVTALSVAHLFLKQAVGGVIYGVVLGYVGYWLIKPIDNYLLEIFITLAIVTGGYTFAQYIDISGPLAMVVAGIFIGNHSRLFYMSEKTRHNLDHFWEVIDNALNAILFLLIGLELNVIKVSQFEIISGVAAIVMVLFARCFSVGLPLTVMKLWRNYEPYAVRIMVWGGLRGALAFALALALPIGPERQIFLPMTYAVVLFSILVQGLSVSGLVRRCNQKLKENKSLRDTSHR